MQALRDLCERNLGPVLFDKLYRYMAERARMVALAEARNLSGQNLAFV